MLKILSQFTTAASLSWTEEILNKYKRSKASTSKRVGVFASSLWKGTIFLLPYSFSISYGSFFDLQLEKRNYIMPMYFTCKHTHKQYSVIKDSQIYIICSISFLLNSKYTYEVAVSVDIWLSGPVIYHVKVSLQGMLLVLCQKFNLEPDKTKPSCDSNHYKIWLRKNHKLIKQTKC